MTKRDGAELLVMQLNGYMGDVPIDSPYFLEIMDKRKDMRKEAIENIGKPCYFLGDELILELGPKNKIFIKEYKADTDV